MGWVTGTNCSKDNVPFAQNDRYIQIISGIAFLCRPKNAIGGEERSYKQVYSERYGRRAGGREKGTRRTRARHSIISLNLLKISPMHAISMANVHICTYI